MRTVAHRDARLPAELPTVLRPDLPFTMHTVPKPRVLAQAAVSRCVNDIQIGGLAALRNERLKLEDATAVSPSTRRCPVLEYFSRFSEEHCIGRQSVQC